MEFREYPLPEVGPDDMLVKIHRANICGSDLHLWRGDGPGMPSDRAVVSGHEMVGTLCRLGRNVRRDCLASVWPRRPGGLHLFYSVRRLPGLLARLLGLSQPLPPLDA